MKSLHIFGSWNLTVDFEVLWWKRLVFGWKLFNKIVKCVAVLLIWSGAI